MALFWGYPDDFPAGGGPPDRDDDRDNGARDWTPDIALGADERIADRAVVALRRDPQVYGRHLEIMVQNRVLILQGDVDSLHVRAAAGRRAWSVPGVLDIANELTVRGNAVGIEELAD
jgi:hypothetical protein